MRCVLCCAAAYVVFVIAVLQGGLQLDGGGAWKSDWRARGERPCCSALRDLAVLALVVAVRGNLLEIHIVPFIGIEITAKVGRTRGWGWSVGYASGCHN